MAKNSVVGLNNPTFTIGEDDEGDQDQNKAAEENPLINKKTEEDPEEVEYIGDVFREIPPDEDLFSFEQCFNSARTFVKIIFALILLSIMSICLVVSKGTTLFLTSQIHRVVSFQKHSLVEGNVTCGTPRCPDLNLGEEERPTEMIQWLWGIFFAQTMPYFLMFFRSTWKMCFKVKDWPSPGIFFFVMSTETLHTIGTFLLFYILMPMLDIYRGLFLLTGVAVLPSFLLMFNLPPEDRPNKMDTEEAKPTKEPGASGKDIFYRFLYVLAFLSQISITIAWYVLIYLEEGQDDIQVRNIEDYCNDTLHETRGNVFQSFAGIFNFSNGASGMANTGIPRGISGYTTQYQTPTTTTMNIKPTAATPKFPDALPDNPEFFWSLLIAPLLISVGYWENFVDKHSKLGSLGTNLQTFREKFNKCKTKTYLLVSLWKITLTLCMLMIYYRTQVNSHEEFTKLFDGRYFPNTDWIKVAGINLGAGMVSFYIADVAIKGRLQVSCYTVPLAFATPMMFGMLTWACQSCDGVWDLDGLSVYWNCYGGYGALGDLVMERFVYIGFAVWFSELWVTRYLWYPKIEKLAKIDKIFIYPMFCGLSLEQSLMFIRRRNDYEFFDRELQEHQKVVKKGKKDKQQKDGKKEAEADDAKSRTTETQEELVAGYNHLFAYEKEGLPPYIYICATMWHEDAAEMKMMLISLLRLDEDQMARRMAQDNLHVRDPDYYMFEVNIFFDDAFTPYQKAEEGFELNEYVTTFITCVNECVENYHNGLIQKPPAKSLTPYGGKLVWTFPSGENKLVVHLKDKQRIRNRKRWSQVMYLHFFLAQGILAQPRTDEEKQHVADNTYILALDGDIDFQPNAVILLLDLMKRNVKVAAACGRIHPTGNGFMVWYQKFEYSLSHWLQKSTEHVLGCVLCSPGCFSLFRGSALMDDNVTASYSKRAEKAIEHVQYDQGEDRWLCTLLLQQGYRVEYSAAADAYTHAPVGFNEFFGQRRRWITSTFANIMDLLKSGRYTAKKNENISMIYMIYQGVLFASSILGPATIFMLIVGAFEAAFMIDPVISFFCGLFPLVVFLIICIKAKNNTQLAIAALLSVIYAVLQMLVVVGIARQMVEDGVCSPSAIFFLFIVGAFLLAGIVHPQEFTTLFHGFLYFLLIPCMYLVLIIYSLCNLHVVSWGTRENKPIKTQAELEAERIQKEGATVAKGAEGWKGLLMSTVTGPNDDSHSAYTCSLGSCCKSMCCVAPGVSPENKKLNRLQRQLTVLQGQIMRVFEHVTTEEYACNSDDNGKVKGQKKNKENNGRFVSNSGCESEARIYKINLKAVFWNCVNYDMLIPVIEVPRIMSTKVLLGSAANQNTAFLSTPTRPQEHFGGYPKRDLNHTATPFDSEEDSTDDEEASLLKRTTVTSQKVRVRKVIEKDPNESAPTPDYGSSEEEVVMHGKQVSPVKQKLLRKKRNTAKPQKAVVPVVVVEEIVEEEVKPPPKLWIEDDLIRKGETKELDAVEVNFWSLLIEKYLAPLSNNDIDKEKITKSLIALRNKAVFAFFIIDIFLMVLILGLNLTIAQTPGLAISWNCTVNGEVKTSQLDPIGFCFIIVFGLILGVQVFGMLVHRLFTFLQIISATIICKSKPGHGDIDEAKYSPQAAIALARDMQKINRNDMIEDDNKSNNTSGYDSTQNSDGESGEMAKNRKTIVEKMHPKPKIENHTTMGRQFAKSFLALKEEAKTIRQKNETLRHKGKVGTVKNTMSRYKKNKNTVKYGQFLEHMVLDNELDENQSKDTQLLAKHGLTMRDVNNQRKKVRSYLPGQWQDDANSLDGYRTETENLSLGSPSSRDGLDGRHETGVSPNNSTQHLHASNPDALGKSQSSTSMRRTPSAQTHLSMMSETSQNKDLYKFSNPSSTLGKSTYPNGFSTMRRHSAVPKIEVTGGSQRNSPMQRQDSLTLNEVDLTHFDQAGQNGKSSGTTSKSAL